MKKLLLITLIFYSLLGNLNNLKAQMVYMPDSMLRLKLTNLGFGACISADSIDASCQQVLNAAYLDVSNYQIHSLQGIQAFTSLNKLICNNNSHLLIPSLPSSLDTLIAQNNIIQSLPILPANLLYLDVSNDSLISLPVLPPTLVYLTCLSNKLTTLPALPLVLKELDCYNNHLTQLPITLPDSLKVLSCWFNQLTSLPILPSSLTVLKCNSNQLTTLPTLPSTLEELWCLNNLLTSLPVLPNSLWYLDCSFNLITSLPILSQSLQQLGCNRNLLTSLPVLPASLRSLDCKLNQISSLPLLPQLWYLNCSSNLLQTLPTLPSTLITMYCTFNLLTSLPTLPNTLLILDCSNNQISNLPVLPESLKRFRCASNLLTTLPSIRFLNNFDCDSNSLTFLPPLPDSIIFLSVNFNPQLTCLPLLTKIKNLYFQGCPVSCLPNYGQVNFSLPSIHSLPLCDVLNPNGCNFYWNISGKTYFDTNLDCNQTMNEKGLRNMHLKLYENGNLIQQAFTGGEGFYSFDINNFNNYEVQLDTTDIPFTSICPSSNSYLDTISISDSLIYGNDFALKCKSGFDIGVWSIYSPGFRPASRSLVNVRAGDIANFYGVHCTSGISGTLNITINGYAHYYGPIAGARTPSNVTGNIITYNITDFGLINSNTDFAFEVETDTSANSGSQICIFASFLPTVGDYNVSNNSLSNCFTVRASFDPNDKEVYPAGITDTSQHWLTYTIRFQNTGSAPADNIYILDSLDNNLDISSFKLLASSHPLYTQILEGGIARFNFPNINLPDSNANEPLSHGYTQYKAKLKDNRAIGTQIQNTAYIYFDFNAPVVTNTTSNTIDIVNGILSKESLSSLNIWPIPFENNFNIQTDLSSVGSHFSIINLLRCEIYDGKINSTQLKINSESWTPGIYFLRIDSKSGSIVRKLIKK